MRSQSCRKCLIFFMFTALMALLPAKAPAQSPQIISLSSNSGVTGTSITITGQNFGSSQGTSTVTFNGTFAMPTTWNSNGTSITVPVPSAATTGDVVVTVGGANSNGLLFTLIPNILAISPVSGPLTTVVEVLGTGFGNSSCSTCLTFNGATENSTSWSDTKIISELPSTLSAGPANVVVTVGGNPSNTVVFTLQVTGTIAGTVSNSVNGAAISGAAVNLYLDGILQTSTATGSNGAYSFSNLNSGTYALSFSASGFSLANISTVPVDVGGTVTENIALSTPSITTLSPSSGPAGTVVTISGSNFGPLQGSSGVTFGGVFATANTWSNNNITVAVPNGAGSGVVLVTVGGAPSNAMTFAVGTGSISGAVSANGAGIAGASVSALQTGVIKASATTGTGGSYSIGSLVPGTYDMEVTASAYGTDAVSGIAVSVGGVATENFALASAGSISGAVTQSNGTTAISGATVTAYQGYTAVGSATTNGSGSYSMSQLAPSTYTVTASAAGYDGSTDPGQTVTSGGTTTANFNLTTQATINYAYDEAGRLKAMVNSLNNDALYTYDAAGNLTSIATGSSSNVAIAEFVPSSGPVGTTVTIYGSAFSGTPSQNTVTFHSGIAASVTSSTATQIVTTVPTGATTGAIKVISPSGNATSSSSFTVTLSNGLPTITSFSPSIATPGTTSVTIDGNNFNATTSNDSLSVNVNKTYAASATSTTLTTSLPGVVTSGHITVTTTLGASTPTSGYLFVTPPGFTPAQVGYTGATTLGSPATVIIGTANPPLIGLLVVDVPASDGLWISTTNNFASSVPYTVYDPFGNIIGSGSIPTGSSSVETTQPIHTAGTCTIMIAPGNQTGNVVLNPAAIPPNVRVPIVVGGPPVTVQTTASGQSAYLTFSGFAGQRIYLYAATQSGYTATAADIGIYNPDGTTLVSNYANYSTWTWYTGLLGPSTRTGLPQTGTYTIYLQPQGMGTYGMTFQLVTVPADVTGTITVGESPVLLATNATGEYASMTFSGTQGQRIYLYAATQSGYTATAADIGIYNPDGTTLVSNYANYSTWTWYTGLLGPSTRTGLPQTGTYTIYLQPQGMGTYGMTFQLVTVPADVTGTITVGGGGVTTTTVATGQYAYLTFSGSVNQVVYMVADDPTGTASAADVGINNPDGSNLVGNYANYSTWCWYTGAVTLPQNGQYTIYLEPSGMGTYGLTFNLTSSTQSCP